ncbi:hypothetical protein DPMN_150410 [Dreissena polymorpha]|uniref:Uncharacterized protein n=1 Tax=Dreissena polymorpha TaxID=45954 RepID=A0A9D4J3B3_DREPO|nr:hypothetical protein DPMN_150410 [Dreissena polymorpha]
MSQKLKAAMVFSIEWNRLVRLIHIRGIPGGEPFTQSCRVLAGSFSQHPRKFQQE